MKGKLYNSRNRLHTAAALLQRRWTVRRNPKASGFLQTLCRGMAYTINKKLDRFGPTFVESNASNIDISLCMEKPRQRSL